MIIQNSTEKVVLILKKQKFKGAVYYFTLQLTAGSQFVGSHPPTAVLYKVCEGKLLLCWKHLHLKVKLNK